MAFGYGDSRELGAVFFMKNEPSINFKEEFSSKIPALTLLMNLGYRYLSPEECLQLRSPKILSLQALANSSNQVMLLPILREFLAAQTFPFEGQQHHLSDAGIDKIEPFPNFV